MNTSSIPMMQGRHPNAAEGMRSLLIAAWHYAEARLRLFWLEGADVMRRGLVLAGMILAAVCGVVIAYAGFMIALALWMARAWWEGDLLPAVAVLATLHLLLAVGCASWAAHAMKGSRFFHATLKEFREDKQWLQESQTSKS